MRSFPCAFSKVLRPEKLAPHLFEVDEDVEKDEVSRPITSTVPSSLREFWLSHCFLTCEENSRPIQQTIIELMTMTVKGQQVQPSFIPVQANLITRDGNRAQTLSFNLLHNIVLVYLISLVY